MRVSAAIRERYDIKRKIERLYFYWKLAIDEQSRRQINIKSFVTKTSYFRVNNSDLGNLCKDFCYRSMRDRLFFSSLLGSSRSGVNIANKWSTNLSPIHFLLAIRRDFVRDVCFLDLQRISERLQRIRSKGNKRRIKKKRGRQTSFFYWKLLLKLR